MSSLKAYLFNLNLFKKTDGIHEDEYRHRSNILATRIYLVVLILALTGLTLGLWLTLQTKKIEIPSPSIDQFKALSIDAQCPCSRHSISYGEFVTLEASFHQVCSSDFISDRWIKAIFSSSNGNNFHPSDFRSMASAQFQVLASLCRLSNESVLNTFTSFYATSLVGQQLLSETLLQSKINASIEQFQSTMNNAFQSQLKLVSDMIFGNQLVSGLRTNILPIHAYIKILNMGQWASWPIIYKSDNETFCSCPKDYNCRSLSGFYDTVGADSSFIVFNLPKIVPQEEVPGLFMGCMPLNSLLQSTLECFYSQTCVNMILSFISTNNNFTAMPSHKRSLFKANSTVQTMVNRTMVELFTKNISYDRYFAQCEPTACTYFKVDRHDFMFVLVEVIGLLGGLISVLKFIIPFFVRFIRRLKLRNPQSTPRIPRM